MSRKYETQHLEFNGRRIAIQIHRERRRSVRFYLGKNGGIIRLPLFLSDGQEKAYLEQFREWLRKQLNKRVDKGGELQPKTYNHGDTIQVGQRSYQLAIFYKDRRTHSGRLAGGVILLTLSRYASPESLQQDIPTLLSRLISNDFLPDISRRVQELNERHFQKDIGQVRLKYTHTVWGSCSRKRNINLSSRLLFAPPDVIDYVIIHELAHLVEMNHSPRFWQLVERAMPDYQEKEKWLKENGRLCSF
jgi:predicted metal-dependent hydrolase